MANELSVTIRAQFAKSGLPTIDVGSATASSVTVSGTILKENIQTVGFAAEEAIDITDIATLGWMYAKNLDAANYLELRPNTGVADMIRLEAGEACLFRLAQDAVPYALANTAACKLHYVIFND